MSGLIPFQFDNTSIRVVSVESGDVEFVASDIATVLSYAEAKDMVRLLDDDERGRRLVPTPGGAQEMLTITEPGLYRVIMQRQTGRISDESTRESVKRFQKWVTHEVLPSIRRTGAYVAPATQAIEATKLFKPFFQIAKMIGCDKQAAAISANQGVQAVTGTNLLALMGKTHMEAESQDAQFFTPTELGKRINTSARGINLLLAEAGLQFKRGDVWEVTDEGKAFARIYDTGKKHGSGVPVQQIKWAASVLSMLGNQEAAA